MSRKVTLPSWVTSVEVIPHPNNEPYRRALKLSAVGDGYDFHVLASLEEGEGLEGVMAEPKRIIAPMVTNLGGAIFEHLYPGKYMLVQQARAVSAVHGTPLTSENAHLLEELRKYSFSVD